MTCNYCAKIVKTVLANIYGVKSVKVNLAGKSVFVELIHEVDDNVLSYAVEKSGYTALCVV